MTLPADEICDLQVADQNSDDARRNVVTIYCGVHRNDECLPRHPMEVRLDRPELFDAEPLPETLEQAQKRAD